PGPACYGRGGIQPTVTDADLLLGYLDPAFFLGGRLALDVAAAEQAIRTKIAEPLGMSPTRAAWGIHQLVNEGMAGAARVHAIERGKDPRSLPLFAFGGAGPGHGFGVARILHSHSCSCRSGRASHRRSAFSPPRRRSVSLAASVARWAEPAWPGST